MKDKEMHRQVFVWNPNPTLDVVNSVAEFTPGAVHRADNQMLSAGGKGTLVVRGLKILGARCAGATPLAGASGSIVRELLVEEELPFDVSHVSGSTRLAITVSERGSGRDTVVNGPGPLTDDDAWKQHVAQVGAHVESGKYDYVVVAGRPPLTTAIADITSITRRANELGLRTVYDMSSPTLEACLPACPWLVKINVSEAQDALNLSCAGKELVECMIDSGAQNAILTSGPDSVHGSLFGQIFTAYPPVVNLKSAVGCGDVFLAGLLFELASGNEGLDAIVRMAVAAASASAEDPQPGFFEPGRAAALKSSVIVGN